jgi:hypothetical protein
VRLKLKFKNKQESSMGLLISNEEHQINLQDGILYYELLSKGIK